MKTEKRFPTAVCLLLLPVLFLLSATACADGTKYTSTSVTSCEQTDARYDRFYQSGQLGVLVPGLAEGLVPQGISYYDKEELLLFCGYRTDKGSSALIAVDCQTGEIRYEADLFYSDGRIYNGHAGGVCITEKDIYISNNHHLYRVSLSAFLAAGTPGKCRFEEEIPVPVNSSFCCYSEGVLWVGEFQYTGDYATDPSHAVRSADGIQRAWICGYRTENQTGFETPDYILSVTERVQGMTTLNGAIYLSQSYGRKVDSILFRYEAVLDHEPDRTVMLNSHLVPLWILDSRNRSGILLAPPMSECLCTLDDHTVCILFESAARTYMNPSNPSVNPLDRVFLLKDFEF